MTGTGTVMVARDLMTPDARGTLSRHLRGDSPMLSVVVPCYNEEEVLPETYARLTRTLSALQDMALELVFVDDGSQDRTPEILRELHGRDPRVRYLRFSRNFGHQIAVSAGIEHARGTVVALIDADLQDPPEVILEMLERWREGWQVAYGVRTERQGEGVFKRWTAKAFYRPINRIADVSIPLDTGDFRLMDRPGSASRWRDCPCWVSSTPSVCACSRTPGCRVGPPCSWRCSFSTGCSSFRWRSSANMWGGSMARPNAARSTYWRVGIDDTPPVSVAPGNPVT